MHPPPASTADVASTSWTPEALKTFPHPCRRKKKLTQHETVLAYDLKQSPILGYTTMHVHMMDSLTSARSFSSSVYNPRTRLLTLFSQVYNLGPKKLARRFALDSLYLITHYTRTSPNLNNSMNSSLCKNFSIYERNESPPIHRSRSKFSRKNRRAQCRRSPNFPTSEDQKNRARIFHSRYWSRRC